jgi:hypothetical protein
MEKFMFSEITEFSFSPLNFQNGQLGVGDTNSRGIPTLIPSENYGIMKIASGGYHTLFLRSESSCYGKSPSHASICSKNGICVNGKCVCEFGFSGNECEFTTCFGKNSSDPNVCSGRGLCSSQDTCKCYAGFIFNAKEKECQSNINTLVYSFGNNNV